MWEDEMMDGENSANEKSDPSQRTIPPPREAEACRHWPSSRERDTDSRFHHLDGQSRRHGSLLPWNRDHRLYDELQRLNMGSNVHLKIPPKKDHKDPVVDTLNGGSIQSILFEWLEGVL